LNFEYSFEMLSEKLKICVTADHKFGTDAFLLSDFAGIRRKDIAVDLGTGCGIVPLLWFRQAENAPKMVYAVDIQPKAIEQLKITLEKNGLDEAIIPVNADLKDLSAHIQPHSADVVTCNPPYKANNSGIISELDSEKIARHEIMCTIYDVCAAAARVLKFGGKLCLCQRPERLADVMQAMRENNIEPKYIRFVQQRPDTAPWLFLIEGKKGSKPYLKVDKPVIIEGENGFSNELMRIYGKV